MLLCNYTMECNSNSVVLYLKAYHISYWNKKPVSKNFVIFPISSSKDYTVSIPEGYIGLISVLETD